MARMLAPLAVALAVGLLAGCSREAPPSEVPVAPANQSAGAMPSSPTSTPIQVDPRIAAACGDLPSAYFAYDSSEVSSEARGALRAIAECFTDGPLASKELRILGHADPRGETEYNFALGHQRASAVQTALAIEGLRHAQMAAVSMGELHAKGSDESGWALDRKVEIRLVD